MATNYNLLTLMFFVLIFLVHFLTIVKSDDTCPYPCYPTPTGTGTPTVTTPPATPNGVIYPPPAGNSYPTPTGYNYPPPTGGNNNFGFNPPPPDPIMPYFPFYFKKPPHQTDQSSAAVSFKFQRSRITILIAMMVIVFLIWC